MNILLHLNYLFIVLGLVMLPDIFLDLLQAIGSQKLLPTLQFYTALDSIIGQIYSGLYSKDPKQHFIDLDLSQCSHFSLKKAPFCHEISWKHF